MNNRFQIEVDGQAREVELRFGTDRDARTLTRWRFQTQPDIEDEVMRHCRQELHRSREQGLARRAAK